MPTNKAKKNGEIDTPKKDSRTPADKILLDFLRKEKLVLIADEISLVTNIVPETIYVVDKRPRIRVFHADQIEEAKGALGEKKVDIVT